MFSAREGYILNGAADIPDGKELYRKIYPHKEEEKPLQMPAGEKRGVFFEQIVHKNQDS